MIVELPDNISVLLNELRILKAARDLYVANRQNSPRAACEADIAEVERLVSEQAHEQPNS